MQCALQNLRAAGIVAGARQNCRAGADLSHQAGTGNGAAEGVRVRAVEDQVCIVEHVAGDRTGRAIESDVETAGRDRGAAVICVGTGQDHQIRSVLLQRAAAGDVAAHREARARAIESEYGIIGDAAGAERACRAAAADLQRAGADRGAAIAVGTRQCRCAGADLAERAAARNIAGKRDGIGPINDQRGIVGDVAGDRAGGAAAAQLQRTGGDRGATAIVVRAGERRRAGAELTERAATRNIAGECDGIGSIDDERGIVGDVAGDRARGAAAAQLQCAGSDRSATAIGVGAGERRRAGADLTERAAARNIAGECDGIGPIDRERGIVGDVAGDRTGGAAAAQLQRTGADRRAATIGIGAGQYGGAGTDLADCRERVYRPGERIGIRTVERECCTRCKARDIAGDRTRRAAIAELNCAGEDLRVAGKGTIAGQNERGGGVFRQLTAARNHAAIGVVALRGEQDSCTGRHGDVARDGTVGGGSPDLQVAG